MTVVSEGVETTAQHLELAQMGCDACQGFYFARPMPAKSLESLIERQADGANVPLRRAEEPEAATRYLAR